MQSVRPDAPWCPSNIEFIRRINGLDIDRRRAAHRLRRELPRARPGRRLPRRAGRDAARSAPPPGHHQVQPGAHLDAGERGRHRRRLPVRLRHGRARAAISSSAAPARCGTAFTRPPEFATGKPWLLRFFDQIRFYPGQRARAARVPRRVSARPGRAEDRGDDLPASPTTARSCDANARLDRGVPRAPAGRVRRRARALGRAAAAARGGRRRRAADAGQRCPPGAIAVRAAVTGSVWQISVPAGTRVAAGDRAGRPRDDEDGDAGARARGRGRRRGPAARPARWCGPGRR